MISNFQSGSPTIYCTMLPTLNTGKDMQSIFLCCYLFDYFHSSVYCYILRFNCLATASGGQFSRWVQLFFTGVYLAALGIGNLHKKLNRTIILNNKRQYCNRTCILYKTYFLSARCICIQRELILLKNWCLTVLLRTCCPAATACDVISYEYLWRRSTIHCWNAGRFRLIVSLQTASVCLNISDLWARIINSQKLKKVF